MTDSAVRLDSRDLFGNDAGEDEDPEVLSSYFVDLPVFRPFFDPEVKFSVARARKGMGKSALIAQLAHTLTGTAGSETVVVRATGSDFSEVSVGPQDGAAQLVARWQERITRLIAAHLGQSIKFAASETNIALVEIAELEGFKERNLLGCLVDRFREKLGMTDSSKVDSESVLGRALGAAPDNLRVWVLIDDIDATFLNNENERLRLATFFSACRGMANTFRGVAIRVTVRSDVWGFLRRFDEALDKVEQYVLDISWTQDELVVSISSKIRAHIQRQRVGGKEAMWQARRDKDRLLGLVFAESWRWDERDVPPDRPLFVLSAGRPRWAAQLCRLAARVATARGSERILWRDVMESAEKYGSLRLDDLYREHAHQCGDTAAVIACLSGGPSRYTTTELHKRFTDQLLRKRGPIDLDGVRGGGTPQTVTRFLFQIGFIAGRQRGVNAQVDYVRFEDQPNLLANRDNWDDGLIWEVQPQYRVPLKIKKREDL